MNSHSGNRSGSRIGTIFVIILTLFQASCGTILHPERCGQPRGRLDVGVVALNGVGLLLFLVPGVVAFAVDFSTGAIYLPPEHENLGPVLGQNHREVRVDVANLTPQRVEQIIQEHAGKTVNLETGTYRVMRLDNLDDFNSETVAGLAITEQPTQVIFRGNDR